MRPRDKRPTPGTGIGIRQAARDFNVEPSVIRYQVGKGIIKRIGDGPLLDAASVWEWYKAYTPHRDNAVRRPRTRTIPEQQAAAVATGHAPASTNGHGILGRTAPIAAPSPAVAPRPAVRQAGGATVLSTREWVQRFYADQARAMGGSIRVNAG